MNKKTMHDMMPPEGGDKSIRNIPVPDRTLRSKFASKKNSPEKRESINLLDTMDSDDSTVNEKPRKKVEIDPVIDVRYMSTDQISKDEQDEDLTTFVVTGHAAQYRKRKRIKIAVGALLVIILVFFGIGATSLFSSSTIQIVRHASPQSFTNEIVPITFGGQDSLAQIIEAQIEVGATVTATEEEYVESKSSGKIIVYNDHSSESQKLIKNTRFESPEGNIYRIQDSIVVPGQKIVDGEIIPGSIEVTVYADEPGDLYNAQQVDFTIPGFKSDTERFANFYARSKSVISGGFKGNVKKISKTDLDSAKIALENEINSKIFAEAEKQIPETFTYFKDLGQISYEDLPQSNANETSVQINMRGSITLPILQNNKFEEFLADRFEDESVTGERPYVSNLSDLTIEYSDQEPTLRGEGEFPVSVNGEVDIYWRLDLEKIKLDLVGEKRKNINNILSEYKTINAAKAFVKPFWKNSFPKKIDNITIEFIESI